MKKLLAVLLAAASLAPVPSTGEEATRTFQVLGVVKKLKPEIRTAVIDHEEIPGYMSAMTMSLEVRDIEELRGINPGDKIGFRMNVTEDDGWIDRLKVIEAAKAPPAESEVPALVPIAVGQPFPDAELSDENGRAFKLSDYRGKAFAVTFIYTLCPFPNFCPRVNGHFRETQALLKGDPTAENTRLLSITIDPARDTQEVLLNFSRTQQADPARWNFATGGLAAITRLTVQSGLDFWDDRGMIQHNLRTIVVDATGNVHKVFSDNELTPDALAKELREAAATKACPCSVKKS